MSGVYNGDIEYEPISESKANELTKKEVNMLIKAFVIVLSA